jgi:DNA-directed RNA polymerase beta subunit
MNDKPRGTQEKQAARAGPAGRGPRVAAPLPPELTPQAQRPPIETVDNGALTEGDMMEVIVAAVDHEGLVGHNIDGFNRLVDEGIPRILTELFHVTNEMRDHREQTELDRQRSSVKIELRFHDVAIGRPTYATYPVGKVAPLYPNEARKTGRTYAAPLSLAVEVTLTATYKDGRTETKRAEVPPFLVALIPMMVGSNRCHTWNLTREARKGLEEDPNESGGYFLAKGGEWVVDWLENISFNRLHVHARMAANERVRGEFISQPGGAFENSSQVIIRLMGSGALTIEINSTKFSKTRIPFFLLFRLLGMTSDGDVLEQVVYDPESPSPVARRMADIVGQALHHRDPEYEAVHHELDRAALTEFMAARLSKFVTNPTAYKSDEHAVQYLNTNLLGILDRVLLPHMGREPAARGVKLRFLGMLIHKTLLVEMGVLPPTDRDSYSNKRAHGAAVSIAKALKTQFNTSALAPALRAVKRELKNTPFEELGIPSVVDAVKGAMASSDLGRTMEQAITSGNKTIVVRRRAVLNRVSTQALERKNPANYYSALRSVSTHNAKNASKQTERADKMRRVHSSYVGYICVAKSADTGEMVGMKKELAITASVCSAGEALPLTVRLLADPAVIPVEAVRTPALAREHLACIFVNGSWVGCCRSPPELVARYRALRRESRVVDPQTTIAWNPITDDVSFLLDVGRLTRPLLIVDNNLAAYDEARRAGRPAAFVQNIRLTPAHVAGIRAGATTLEDLRAEGVLEWITPEEAENCLVAPSLAALRAAAGDVTARYTHCDIEQAIFGLTALVSPFGNHTQPARVTYETNQGRQAGGWYSFAFPFRVDKNRFFQHYNEVPLVRTLAYNWLYPNGMNTVVAYMINGGYNQEDSAVVKRAFAQRGGFAGSLYRFEKAELEKGEAFGTPDPTVTKNLKPNASYEKLVDGFVLPGAIVRKGDVLIGRVAKIQASSAARRGPREGGRPADDGYQFVDRSVVYHLAEPAEVIEVLRPRGPNDNKFGLVKLRYDRPLGVGDKMCLTPDHDVLTAAGWRPIAEVSAADEVACLLGGRLAYRRPSAVHAHPHRGPLYRCSSHLVDLRATLDHRMWVRRPGDASFRFERARDVAGQAVCFLRNAPLPPAGEDVAVFVAAGPAGPAGPARFPMDPWLHLLGLFLAAGSIAEDGAAARLDVSGVGRDFVDGVLRRLHISAAVARGPAVFSIRDRAVVAPLAALLAAGPAAVRLPGYVWRLNRRQCRLLLEAVFGRPGLARCRQASVVFHTRAPALAGDLQRLALHAGWSANLTPAAEGARLELFLAHNQPAFNFPPERRPFPETETVEPYSGPVHCLTVPGGLFYVRRRGRPVWTGNSSRAGNKSIAALLLPESDLPYDEDGVTPDIIINPHSIPSRMTIGQMLETTLSLRCQEEGVITDGTAFRSVSVDEISKELAEIGLRYNGLSRLYNGRTGEHYDAAIFMGPTYHQRLQKFVKDDKYAVGDYGPTDALTGQPLEGKNARGGLRVGEMATWVLESHGAMAALTEKLMEDSDGQVQFLCRTCGNPAIYNGRQGFYRCTTCGEGADIGAVDSCRASIVFQHEMRAANVKVSIGVRPREFEKMLEPGEDPALSSAPGSAERGPAPGPASVSAERGPAPGPASVSARKKSEASKRGKRAGQ